MSLFKKSDYYKENKKTRPRPGAHSKKDTTRKTPKQELEDGIRYLKANAHKKYPEIVKYRLSKSPIKTDYLQKDCEGT